MHFAADFAPFATTGSFIIALILFVDRFFPQLRPSLMAKGSQLRRWVWPSVFLAISLVSGIAWYVTSSEPHKGSLETRFVDKNLYQITEANPTNHTVFFFMEIYNPGRPTIVRDWLLKVTGTGINETTNVFLGFCQRYIGNFLGQNITTNAPVMNYYIFEKTRRNPIPSGGMENGFIEFSIVGPQGKWLKDSTTRYDVSFSDVYGNSYTNHFNWPPPEP